MWLTGRLVPDHKTIADFRKDNGRAIRQVCGRFVALCRSLGLFTEASVAIDGRRFGSLLLLAGVSVRRVEGFTEALWDTRVSPSTVSDLNSKIYGTIEAWRNPPIEGEHPYVYLDGIVLKRSWAGEVNANCSSLLSQAAERKSENRLTRDDHQPVTTQHGQVNHCNHRQDRNGDGNRMRKYPRDRRSADDVEPADERQNRGNDAELGHYPEGSARPTAHDARLRFYSDRADTIS
jgi:hypothetical protein